MLADPAALLGVVEGEHGILAGLRPGTVLIDSSTVSPPTTLRAIVFSCVDRKSRLFLERSPNSSKRSTPKCRDEINYRQRDDTDASKAELLLASSDRQADSSRPGSEKNASNQPNEPPLGFVKFAPPQHSSKW